MSTACNNVQGSRFKMAITENANCAATATLHNLIVTPAAVVGATSITIGLDPASTAPVYTATSVYPLTSGTILNFGGNLVEVTNAANGTNVYNLTTTPIPVNVKRLKAPIANNATVTSYLGLRLCLTSANIATNTVTVDNTTNCSGTLFTNINVGSSKELEMMGFLSTKDFSYQILDTVGAKQGTFFFALDLDGGFYIEGQVQVTDTNVTQVEVKNIAKYSVKGQIQSIDYRAGSFVPDAAALVDLELRRSRWGFSPSRDVTVNPLAV